MPTFGKHRGSVAGSPLHNTLTRFATAHGLRRAYTLDKCVSPAGLQPVAPAVTAHLRRVFDGLLAEDARRRGAGDQQQQKQVVKEEEEEKTRGGPGACKSKEMLSRAGLEEFLRNVQRDPKKPSWSFSTAEGFSFEDFVQFWWAEYSAAKRPIYPEDKDLDKPISNYFISSSHNTYIEDGNQITGEAKALQYKKVSWKPSPPSPPLSLSLDQYERFFAEHAMPQVLESGCRCVEIDVWNGTEADEDSDRNSPERSSSAHKSEKKKNKQQQQQHWSFSSMVSWMRAACMPFPRGLRPKRSEASFRARPPRRARAISDPTLHDSESRRASLLAREPRVCHAYESRAGDVTLHEAIPFRTVCETIRESAFSRGNDLPVIISLEVHANGPQQEKMVQIMRDEWGSLLLDEALPGYDPLTTQPPLRELRRKILIKVKTGSVASAGGGAAPSPSLDSNKTTLLGSEPSDCGSSQHGTLNLGPKRSAASGSAASSAPRKKHAAATTVEALRRLAIYTYSPGAFTSFARADSTAPAHIYSFGEERLKALHRTEHNQVFRHNRGFLARTFPESLSSFLSSNPNCPTLFWRKGVQMVALNWQVWDTAMEINDAMFDRERGWVLKPPGYRSGGEGGGGGGGVRAADCQADVAGKKRMDLTITVLAGQHIPTPDAAGERGCTTTTMTRLRVSDAHAADFRPRVTCFLHVESAAERDPRRNISKDEISQRTRTASTEQPDWGPGGWRLKFSTVRHVVEELSFVRYVSAS